MNKYIILFFSFFNFFLKGFDCYVVYPLKTLEEGDNKIESLLSFNSTYTVLEIGTPPQKVNFYFDLNHPQINITEKGCGNKSLYNKTSSTSYKFGLDLELAAQDNNTKCLVLDTLYFYNNLNLTKILKIPEYPLYYSSNISKNDINLCGNIGLSVVPYGEYNLESQEVKYYTEEIKKLGAGKYEDFSFYHYKNQDFLILDIFLQSEFPDLFKGVKEVEWAYISMRSKDYNLYWETIMKEIHYNHVHSKTNIRFEINPLFELIVGTNDFKANITNDFFSSYIQKGICILKKYKAFNVFECNQETFTNKDIIKFPTIYIDESLKLEYSFELKPEELFININNKWYFEIVFPVEDFEEERWILGRIFMRKYPVKFSPLSRLIGFYLKNDKENKKPGKNETETATNSNKNNKIIFYIIIIVIALIFTGVGLFLGKKLFYPRKKRANELLDDNYEYEYNSGINEQNKIEDGNKNEDKNKFITDDAIN